jgi:hypothetical protein
MTSVGVTTEYFPHPVGILLFNRPHLAKYVLRSLMDSRLKINEELLVFHLDGYIGSKYEEELERDRTTEIEKLIKRYFPRAHVIKQDQNIGIAESFFVIKDYIFKEFESEFAIFQEEDTLLYPHYFEVMNIVIDMIQPISWIGAISINNVDHYLNEDQNLLVPTFGTRELLIRREVFIQSRDMYLSYLNSLGESYRTKDLKKVNKCLKPFNINLKSPMQDVFQHEALRDQNKLHIRINLPGSLQANFSAGESISGLSILNLVKEYLGKIQPNKSSLANDLKLLQSAAFKEQELRKQEDLLWQGWWTKHAILSMENKNETTMIIFRNRIGLSRFKHLLESMIISKRLRSFRSYYLTS